MKIVNPKEMYDNTKPPKEDGSREYSGVYKSLISFLEEQIKIESEVKDNIEVLTTLKRRLHSLTANFVEYYVGGVSAADRDNVRDLVEDAILNCRSALDNGIGYGAGFEGLRATQRYNDDLNNIHDLHGYSSDLNLKKIINKIIFKSYETIIMKLYKSAGMSDEDADKLYQIKNKVQD